MRVDLYTKMTLTLIVLLLAVIAVRPIVQPQPASAQGAEAGIPYGYLFPVSHVGDPDWYFVDLRNGRLWECNFKRCGVSGTFPLEKTR